MGKGRATLLAVLVVLGSATGAAAGALAGDTPSKSRTTTVDTSEGANGLFLFAFNQVGHRMPRCFGVGGTTMTTFDHGAPGARLLDTLGVLRRPRTRADRLPRSLIEQLRMHALLIDYVRRVKTPDGSRYLILPSSDVHYSPFPPRACDAALASAIRRHG